MPKFALSKKIITAILSIALLTPVYASNQAFGAVVKAGATCTKTGQIKKTATQTLKCTLQGKKKV